MAVVLQEHRVDQELSGVKQEMAHLRGVVEQLAERVSGIESRMDSNFKWIVGLILTSWITLTGLIISLSLKGR